MARQSRAPSYSDSDVTASSEDEERAVGRGSSRSKASSGSGKRSSKSTTYRSLPTATGTSKSSSKKGAAPPPSDSESQGTASDAHTASASDSEGGASKERKEPRSAPVATSRPQQEEKKSNTLWWILGGVIVVILIAAGVGLFLYNKNSTSTDASDSSALNSSSSDTSASAGSLPIATPSATSSSALNGTSSGPLASSTSSMNDTDSALNSTATTTGGISSATGASNLTMGTGDEMTDGSEAIDAGTITDGAASTSWVPSLTADSPQSTSISTSNPSETQTTRATYFVSDNGVTPCLSRPNDGDFVVHVSPKFYGDLASVSPRCGAWVSMWNEATDYTVSATIEGVCANCEDYQIDVSQAAFFGLTTDMDVGEITVQWWFTPDDKKPKASLTSFSTGAAAATKHKTATKADDEVTIQTVRARVRL